MINAKDIFWYVFCNRVLFYLSIGNRVGDDIGGINGKVNGIKLESLHASKVGPLVS